MRRAVEIVMPDEMAEIAGPFGPADYIHSVPVSTLATMYRAKCGVDPTEYFAGLHHISLYQCRATEFRFWRPENIAGSEAFYRALSAAWDDYYQEWRWEYDRVLQHLPGIDRLVEIGCGRGYFLAATEDRVEFAKGLEFNNEAIANRVTRWPVEALTIEQLAQREPNSYDCVCSFQVLEHVVDPAGFIKAALAVLKPGGIMAFSVPNYAHRPFQRGEDAFDLPPHHMNHFTEEAFAKIAALFGIQLVKTYTVRHHFPLTSRDGASLISGARTSLKNVLKMAVNQYYRITREPGHTMLAIFRNAPTIG